MADIVLNLSANAPANAKRPPCQHTPTCPLDTDSDHDAARVVAAHPEQGFSLLCNGVIVFDDTGELSPSGVVTAPHRPDVPHCSCTQHTLCPAGAESVREALIANPVPA